MIQKYDLRPPEPIKVVEKSLPKFSNRNQILAFGEKIKHQIFFPQVHANGQVIKNIFVCEYFQKSFQRVVTYNLIFNF